MKKWLKYNKYYDITSIFVKLLLIIILSINILVALPNFSPKTRLFLIYLLN